MANSIDRLPVELLVQVFGYLASAAPSTLKARKEPSLELTTSPHHTLKDVSQTSRGWRRIVLPLLFRDSHISLSVEPSREVSASACPVCRRPGPRDDTPINSQAIPYDVDAYHWALFSHAKEEVAHDAPVPIDKKTRQLSLEWAGRMYHAVKDYLHFLAQNDLTQHVRSLVLSTERMLPTSDRFPHYQARSDYRYRAAAEIWHHVFSKLGLSRVVIVACPSDMACLTNCAIDLFGDWAFSDMQYHLLELGMDSESKISPIPPVDYASLSGVPEVYPGIAPSSILKLRPWSELALNEGSFLKGYATYEYFERGPPSLIYSIKDLVASNRRAFHPHNQGGMDLRSLRKFTYSAILPFATHMDFRGLLPYIDELDVKLAPDVDSHILDDKKRVGTAQLDDCWQELFTAYRLIIRPFRTFDIRPDGSPKLKKFICRDMMHPGLRDELDDEFIALCLPVWAEMSTPGVFERQMDVPYLPPDEFAQ